MRRPVTVLILIAVPLLMAAAPEPKPKITMKDARTTALKKAPGTIKSSELENEHGRLIYSFDIETKKGTITEVNVDANNGQIVAVQNETPAREAAEKKQEQSEKISMKRAQSIALNAAPGTITRSKLEKHRGKLLYAINVKTREGIIAEVDVDAKTGKVIDVRDQR